MNKKRLIIVGLIIFSCIYACAQDNNENVDWDKMELHLYNLVRYKYPDASEAQIEYVVGRGLLEVDNQWERATVHLKKAVRLDPKLHMAWYNLGLIYCYNEEGYNYFKKATEAKPDFAAPYYWMAYYRCQYGQDKEAILLFQKYLEVAKGNTKEAGRIEVAEKALQDLLSGKEDKDLSIIRRTYK